MTGSASSAGWATSWSRCSGDAPAAPGWPSGSGSRTCRRRWPPAATTGRSSTTPTFRAAAIPEEDLWGPYTTEDQGRLLTVFGTEQGLRYRIPFRDVEDVIGYLRDHATDDGGRVGMMGDDGEKFGAWPTTWQHCWGERAAGSPGSSRRWRPTPIG